MGVTVPKWRKLCLQWSARYLALIIEALIRFSPKQLIYFFIEYVVEHLLNTFSDLLA